MKYLYLTFVIFFYSSVILFAQKPTLKFNEEGKFKIIQITDTHFILGNSASDVVPALLNEIIEEEKPDLLVFTGDMVWKNKETAPALDALFAPVIAKGVPWAYVFGNHDDESDMSRTQIMEHVTQMPYCIAEKGDQYLSGIGNYALEVRGKNDAPSAILYCLDSHAYPQIKGIGGYAWFQPDQVDWYRKQSAAYTILNEGKPLPALAFFHIPLPEYVDMARDRDALVGNKNEAECNGKLNTGMFSAMRIAGDVMGTFVGHDHDNDYIGNWYDIYLAYGRYSGGKTVYNNLGNNGCRVIELTENKREFSTYIRLLGGEKLAEVHYPNTFKNAETNK